MQNINKIKINLIFLFTFYSIYLFSQNPLSINLHFYHGITGFKKDIENAHDNFYSRSFTKMGNEISLGVGVNYIYGVEKKFSLSGNILWNFYSFQDQVESFGVSFGRRQYEDNLTLTYDFQSLLIPLKLNRDFKYFGISIGLVPRMRSKSRITWESFNSGTSNNTTDYTYEVFQFYEGIPISPSEPAIMRFKSKFDFQYLVGINYQASDKITFRVEFRNLILKNKLQIDKQDFIDPNSGTVSLGVSCKIFKRK